jgi:hypothetical protein
LDELKKLNKEIERINKGYEKLGKSVKERVLEEKSETMMNLITEVMLEAPKQLKLNDDDWQLVKLMLANIFQKTEQLVRKECEKELKFQNECIQQLGRDEEQARADERKHLIEEIVKEGPQSLNKF